MKIKKFLSFVVVFMIATFSVSAQTIYPALQFNEDPKTHNMHICSDGKYFYTVNGGKSLEGQINKFSLEGKLLKSIPIELDMRGIVYHKKNKCFYVSSYDQNIYKICDIDSGVYELVFSGLFDNEQSCIAADVKDKYFYSLNLGVLSVYDFESGQKVKTIKGIMCGDDLITGGVSLAVDKKHIYTFNSIKGEVYIYGKKNFKYIDTRKIAKGDYGFSISAAKGYVFIATDGDYGTGTWYGYKF